MIYALGNQHRKGNLLTLVTSTPFLHSLLSSPSLSWLKLQFNSKASNVSPCNICELTHLLQAQLPKIIRPEGFHGVGRHTVRGENEAA